VRLFAHRQVGASPTPGLGVPLPPIGDELLAARGAPAPADGEAAAGGQATPASKGTPPAPPGQNLFQRQGGRSLLSMDEQAEAVRAETDVQDAQQQLQQHLGGARRRLLSFRSGKRHEQQYDVEWQHINASVLEGMGLHKDMPFSVFVHGTSHALLGVKLARMFQRSTVLNVIHQDKPQLQADVVRMAQAMNLHNHLTVSGTMNPTIVRKLAATQELHRLQILGLEVFHELASLGESFVVHLGRILTMASTTFIEVPSPDVLVLATACLGHTDTDTVRAWLAGLIADALHSAGSNDHTITVLQVLPGSPRVVRVDIRSMRRTVTDCGGSQIRMEVEPGGVAVDGDVQADFPRAGRAISLQFFLYWMIETEERLSLFERYMSLQLHEDMCPINVVFFGGHLVYVMCVLDA